MPHEGRVLIVEDEKAWIEKYKRILSSINIENRHSAGTLKLAQGLLKDHIYDLIILDLRLEGRKEENFDGMDLLNDLKSITEEQGTQVIIVSGYGTIPIAREAFKRYGVFSVRDKSELAEHLDDFKNDVKEGIEKAYSIRDKILQEKFG